MTDLTRLGMAIYGEGSPIVLIMGRGAPGRVWEAHQVPSLVAHGWKVITFDNRGIGNNFVPGAQFSFQDFILDVISIIEQNGNQPAFLVGTSLGSRIALGVARQRPDLVRGVVAAAAHARMTPVQQALSRHLADATKALADAAPEYLAAHTAAMNLSRATLLDDAANHDWLAMLSFSGSTHISGIAAQIRADCGDDHSDIYRQITVPVVALAYGDDRVIFPEQVQEVANIIPQARYVELAHAGHFGYLERPSEFNSIVQQFIAEFH